jgi:hypothetical protein
MRVSGRFVIPVSAPIANPDSSNTVLKNPCFLAFGFLLCVDVQEHIARCEQNDGISVGVF